MNKNDQHSVAQKIRERYTEKQQTELDTLRELDAKVKRPANVFSYVFGSIGALIMGGGMSLVMTDLAATLGLGDMTVPGITIGVMGLFLALINYPIYKGLLESRKEKYAPEIIGLSEKIINNNQS